MSAFSNDSDCVLFRQHGPQEISFSGRGLIYSNFNYYMKLDLTRRPEIVFDTNYSANSIGVLEALRPVIYRRKSGEPHGLRCDLLGKNCVAPIELTIQILELALQASNTQLTPAQASAFTCSRRLLQGLLSGVKSELQR